MKTSNPRNQIGVLALMLFGLVAVQPLSAELRVEWDFFSGDGNIGIAADRSTFPFTVSKLTTNLNNNATFSTGVNTGLENYHDALHFGSMNVSSGIFQGIRTRDDPSIPGEDSSYRAYMDIGGGGFYTSTTVAVVFKPNFSGIQTATHVFFSLAAFNSSVGISLGQNSGGDLFLNTGISGPSGNSATATIVDFNWDSNTWYFLAGSLEEFQLATVYARPLTGPGTNTSFFATSTTLVNDRQPIPSGDGIRDTTGPSSQPYRVGGTEVFGGAGDDFGADGTFARVQVFKNYIGTQAGFDNLYALQLIPEPSALALLILCGSALLLRRKRK